MQRPVPFTKDWPDAVAKCVLVYKQDTKHSESRVPRLNVHTNQILAHTFSHGTLDSVVS